MFFSIVTGIDVIKNMICSEENYLKQRHKICCLRRLFKKIFKVISLDLLEEIKKDIIFIYRFLNIVLLCKCIIENFTPELRNMF